MAFLLAEYLGWPGDATRPIPLFTTSQQAKGSFYALVRFFVHRTGSRIPPGRTSHNSSIQEDAKSNRARAEFAKKPIRRSFHDPYHGIVPDRPLFE